MRPLYLCLLLCLLHGVTGSVAAQSPELPGWLVPVLRLVSATHVEPTTGVVLSADGLVLVPAEFASVGDEIVVLDGGRDIVRDGRPARLESGYPELGLKVLRVEGLHRRPAPLAPGVPEHGATVRLRAFPPAEQIAEGASPVDATAKIVRLPESETPSLDRATPLPNVTGALLDECGNLAGFSIADGVQSLSSDAAPRYRWAPALRDILSQLRLPATGTPCSGQPVDVAQPQAAEEPPAEPPVEQSQPEPEPLAREPEALPEAEQSAEQAPQTTAEPEPALEEAAAEQDRAGEAADQAATGASRSWWAIAALFALAGGFIGYRMRRRRHQASAGAHGAAADREPAAPGAPAGTDSGERWLQPPPDSLLVLRGALGDGRPFTASVGVCSDAINVEIGRGSADLAVDSTSVSRRHARLNGTAGALTLTDLGSSNGSSINGVPCLEGEIMYVEPGDTVTLGDARFTVSVTPRPPGGQGE